MKTLHLNLKRKWFDMILSGDKEEEYREIKKHWLDNLTIMSIETLENYQKDDMCGLIRGFGCFGSKDDKFKIFDTITFSNGYKKDRPQFEIELKSIKIDTGNTRWGAIENEKYFVLELGNIIRRENIK